MKCIQKSMRIDQEINMRTVLQLWKLTRESRMGAWRRGLKENGGSRHSAGFEISLKQSESAQASKASFLSVRPNHGLSTFKYTTTVYFHVV